MNEILKKITEIGLVPVMNIKDTEDAIPLARALYNGGLPIMEVMFRTDAAAESIRLITDAMPDFLVGAGTILTIEQAKKAVDSGAKFLVSPGFNSIIVKFAIENKIPIVPGCVTPTEIEAALEMGLEVLKFFPAIQMGGVSAMKLLSGPYPSVRFMPTGDLTIETAKEYLGFHKVAAAGGDFMLSYEDIKQKRFDKVEESVRQTITEYFNFKVAHFGMNCKSEEEAKTACEKLSDTLGLAMNPFEKCFFSGSLFEVMKSPFFNKCGHVAIGTKDADRAVAYLKRKGYKFHEETNAYDENGCLKCSYLDNDYNGFALHILKVD